MSALTWKMKPGRYMNLVCVRAKSISKQDESNNEKMYVKNDLCAKKWAQLQWKHNFNHVLIVLFWCHCCSGAAATTASQSIHIFQFEIIFNCFENNVKVYAPYNMWRNRFEFILIFGSFIIFESTSAIILSRLATISVSAFSPIMIFEFIAN